MHHAANNLLIQASFGNFVNRALKFVSAQFEGVLPDSGDPEGPYSPNDEEDAEFISDINNLLKEYIAAMDVVKLRLGLQTIMLISARGNTYLQASGLNKALIASNPKRCAQVVSRTVNLIYILSALVYPFMPATSESILAQLNAPARTVPEVLSNDILAGHTIGTPDHLFKKIEEKMADVWRAKFGGNDAQSGAPTPDPLKTDPGAKGKKKKGAAAPVPDGPKTPEALALEEKIDAQGKVVRELKAKAPKTPELEAEIKAAVDELLDLKKQRDAALKA